MAHSLSDDTREAVVGISILATIGLVSAGVGLLGPSYAAMAVIAAGCFSLGLLSLANGILTDMNGGDDE
jgi:hypothetical protein